jgi:hypothetical protein
LIKGYILFDLVRLAAAKAIKQVHNQMWFLEHFGWIDEEEEKEEEEEKKEDDILPTFDMDSLYYGHVGMFDDAHVNPSILAIGRRSSGKTVLFRDILQHQPTIPLQTVVGISPDEYTDLHPELESFRDYDPAILERATQRLPVAPSFLVLDDCWFGDEKQLHADAAFMNLIRNVRHHRVTPLIATQFFMMEARMAMNFSHVFLLRDAILYDRKRVYKMFGGGFATFEAFCAAMDQATADHGALVLDMRTGLASRYRASLVPRRTGQDNAGEASL